MIEYMISIQIRGRWRLLCTAHGTRARDILVRRFQRSGYEVKADLKRGDIIGRIFDAPIIESKEPLTRAAKRIVPGFNPNYNIRNG